MQSACQSDSDYFIICTIKIKLSLLFIIYLQVGDETVVSEWSLHSENQRITSAILPSSVESMNEDGRVSLYFKAKSNNMGLLSPTENVERVCNA